MYSAYKLNKHSDNIQPSCTPFPILKQSVVPCLVLTITFWPAYSFLRKQVRWSGIPISQIIFQFVVIHTIKGFSVVKEAEVDGILLLFQWSSWCWQLISGSFAFSKSSLNVWKFSVQVLLKHSLENFDITLTLLWDECFPIYLPWSDGTDAMILVFWLLSFKPTFSLSSFTFIWMDKKTVVHIHNGVLLSR